MSLEVICNCFANVPITIFALANWLFITGEVPTVDGRKRWRITDEHKEAIGRVQKGRKHTAEQNRITSETTQKAMANPLLREHMRVKQIMRLHPPLPDYHKDAISRGHMGVRPSEETRGKLREATRGTKRRVGLKNTPEAKANMSKAQKKVWSDTVKPLFMLSQKSSTLISTTTSVIWPGLNDMFSKVMYV